MINWLRFFYCLLLCLPLFPGEAAATSSNQSSCLAPAITQHVVRPNQAYTAVKEAGATQIFPTCGRSKLFTPRGQLRLRFKIPESGFQLNFRHSYALESLIAAFIVATIIAAYRQPYYLSQQYAYLFRLTPF